MDILRPAGMQLQRLPEEKDRAMSSRPWLLEYIEDARRGWVRTREEKDRIKVTYQSSVRNLTCRGQVDNASTNN